MQAKPCTSPTSIAAPIPAARPAQAEPVTAAVAAAANADASILPSRPISTMPERSAKRPPRAASTSGAAPRAVAAASSARSRAPSFTRSSSSRASRQEARRAGQDLVPGDALAVVFFRVQAGDVELRDRPVGLEADPVASAILQSLGPRCSRQGRQRLKDADREQHVHRAPLGRHGKTPPGHAAQVLAARLREPEQSLVRALAEPPGPCEPRVRLRRA